MKKIIALLLVVIMTAGIFACTGGNNSGNGTEGTKPSTDTAGENADTTGTSGEDTTGENEDVVYEELLEFAVTEGDYGDMFRSDANWTGSIQKIESQTMSVTCKDTTEQSTVWEGPAAGKSFEYETKLKVSAFADSYVKNVFNTETNEIEMVIYKDKIIVCGNEIAVETDDEYHLYRFSVVDGKAKFCIDAVKKAEFDVPEKAGKGLISFSTVSNGSSSVMFDVKYVKVKNTDETWTKPEDRIHEITDWTYVEDFTESDLDKLTEYGWVWNGVSGATASDKGDYKIEDGMLQIVNGSNGEFNTEIRDSRIPSKTNKGSYTLEIKYKIEGSGLDSFNFVAYLMTGSRLFIQNKPSGSLVRDTEGNMHAFTSDNIVDGEWHTIRYDVTFDENSNSVKIIHDGNLAGTWNGLHANGNANTFLTLINYSADAGIDTTIFIDYIKILTNYQ